TADAKGPATPHGGVFIQPPARACRGRKLARRPRMSTFESDDYRWRETYFVLFDAERRPSLRKVQQAIERLKDRFELSHPAADDSGAFESLTVMAPDDYAALDISYVEGEEVQEQVEQLM